ncbi:hypothetical protein BS47DRAFT_1325234 [Hydnum rufescens UP504]|uniref:C2 domain-containing protein n=1 Tax=Hydnum rufescens UP504 TaxID=1448309 RepID=A0A9P6E0Y9_9AGAM|nr:hypothetical protein BS47DRAFT_1325234 [Hydnum rufescens UP504]
MSNSAPREIGTLIIVVLKAKNLPNKRHIGKQDPYCSLELEKETRRTRAVKKGGQHPEWDQEIRFSLLEDTEDVLARTKSNNDDEDIPPPVPSKTPTGKLNFNKNRSLRLSCYADDPREAELIGEVIVNLTEVLTKGETDEWYILTNKDKYSGEVYLEMTFWSNEKAPVRSKVPRVSSANSHYGGSGFFTPAGPSTPEKHAPLQSGRSSIGTRDWPSSSSPQYKRAGEILPDTRPAALPDDLRPSSSLANLDLYVAPYEHREGFATPRPHYDEFGAANAGRRRESFPPVAGHHRPRSESGAGYAHYPSSQSFTHHPSATLSESMSGLSIQSSASNSSYGRPLPQTGGNTPSQLAYYEPEYEQYDRQYTGGGFVPAQPSSTPFLPHTMGITGYVPPRGSPSPFAPPAIGSTGFAPPAPSRTPLPSSSFVNPQRIYSHDTTNMYPPQSAPTPRSSSYFQPQHPTQINPPIQRHQPQYQSYPSSTHNQPHRPQQFPFGGQEYAEAQPEIPPQQSHQHQYSGFPPPSHPPAQSSPLQPHYNGYAAQDHHQEPVDGQSLSVVPPPRSPSASPTLHYGNGIYAGQASIVGPPPALDTNGPQPSNGSIPSRPLPDPQQQMYPHSQSVMSRPRSSFGGNGNHGLSPPRGPARTAVTPPPPPQPSSYQHPESQQQYMSTPPRVPGNYTPSKESSSSPSAYLTHRHSGSMPPLPSDVPSQGPPSKDHQYQHPYPFPRSRLRRILFPRSRLHHVLFLRYHLRRH